MTHAIRWIAKWENSGRGDENDVSRSHFLKQIFENESTVRLQDVIFRQRALSIAFDAIIRAEHGKGDI